MGNWWAFEHFDAVYKGCYPGANVNEAKENFARANGLGSFSESPEDAYESYEPIDNVTIALLRTGYVLQGETYWSDVCTAAINGSPKHRGIITYKFRKTPTGQLSLGLQAVLNGLVVLLLKPRG